MNFKLKTPNSKTSSLILFYAHLADGKRFVYSTGQKLPVRLWDRNSQLPRKTKSQQDQMIVNTVNLRLDSIRSSYLKIDLEYKTQGKILTKELLRQEFDAIFKGVKMEETPIGFDDCFEDFYNYKLKEGIWSKSTATRYKMIYKLLKEYESQDSVIDLEAIDERWITNFKSYCENVKFHQVNTVGRNIGLIKTFLNYCVKRAYITNTKFRDTPVKREVTHQLVLTKEEIQQIADLDLSNNKRLERVRDVFLIGCYTGMRYSDFKRIKPSNVSNNMIMLREIKDKTKFLEIPITEKSMGLLIKYNMELPVISEQKFRDYLKEIFKIAGFTALTNKSIKIGNRVYEQEVPMYELLSTHTARRSFITIMLNSGVPAKAIMKITGHKSINNFQLYYRPSNAVLSDFMNKVWG